MNHFCSKAEITKISGVNHTSKELFLKSKKKKKHINLKNECSYPKKLAKHTVHKNKYTLQPFEIYSKYVRLVHLKIKECDPPHH